MGGAVLVWGRERRQQPWHRAEEECFMRVGGAARLARIRLVFETCARIRCRRCASFLPFRAHRELDKAPAGRRGDRTRNLRAICCDP